jgi:DnaJ-class molecular chaperone
MNQDPYQVLGVSPSDDEATIKKAYKKLAMKHHPDREGGSEAKMKEITEAYNRIKKGDIHGPQGFYGDQGFYSSSGMSQDDLADLFGSFGDIFSQHFGQGPGTAGHHPDRKYRNTNRKGRDISLDLPLSFKEMWFGSEQIVRLNGNTLSIKTPAGIRDGAKIRYAGHGLPPSQLGTPGDLIITVKVQKDNKYNIDGNKIIANQEVSVWDAMLGDDIEYTHIDDRILKVSISPGTQNGQMFRIPGYGINGGDLMIKIHIKIPDNLTKEQKSAIVKWKNKK